MIATPHPAPPSSDAAAHERWPAERFYWALLDAPGMKEFKPGPLPPGLMHDLADEVPVSTDDLHAVAALHEGKLLVCAALRAELGALPVATTKLTPAELPSFGTSPASLDSLNLLVGEFEPASQRASRSRRHLLGLTTVALLAALLFIGFTRRAAHDHAIATQLRTTTDRAVAKVLPIGMPAEAIASEVARLKQASQATTQAAPAADAAVALAALLRSWPAAVPCKPQSIAVSESGMTISVLVEGEYAPFLSSFTAPPGWTILEPRVNSTGGGGGGDEVVRIAIDLKRDLASGGTR